MVTSGKGWQDRVWKLHVRRGSVWDFEQCRLSGLPRAPGDFPVLMEELLIYLPIIRAWHKVEGYGDSGKISCANGEVRKLKRGREGSLDCPSQPINLSFTQSRHPNQALVWKHSIFLKGKEMTCSFK